MTTIRTLLAAALLAIASPAVAQGYIGLGIGQVRTGGESDTKPLLVAGWRFGQHWGVEASYFDAAHLTGMGVAATARVPISGNFSAFGKLGFHAVERETVIGAGSVPGGPGTTVKTDYGSRASAGIGLAYSLNERVAMRALAERIDGKDDLKTVTIFYAGIEFRF